ncbi:hypothetical protein Cme02nite_29340 [Catellatospora methionotrophica]|uniref:DUF4126 domain-containing protein n=1 Tax=Catellatospora methionotrophica TaxID=121620 RepID=A0A8J3L914_9ACTN|nr:hypothetical protein [Catellatospora methionotrophica]GIG14602.1 hypothetical protein Cme02nite_29340 [Catellatospora methionotrophica]
MGAITILRPLALGMATGMRSQLGLAALAVAMSRGGRKKGKKSRGFSSMVQSQVLSSPLVRKSLVATAATELVADKLPSTPSRLNKGPLLARLALGGLAGGLLGWSDGRGIGRAAAGAALGATGAGLGAYGGYHVRAALDGRTQVADRYWALAEDVTAVGLAAFAVAVTDDTDDAAAVEQREAHEPAFAFAG